MSTLIADYNLGSSKHQAQAQVAELKRQFKQPRFDVQLSQHAPEGYDNAYSVQVFDCWPADMPAKEQQ